MSDPTCPKCQEAGLGQFFSYDYGDGRVWHFDVTQARHLARRHPDTLGLFAVADLLEHARQHEIDPAHVPHVDERLPLLAVTLAVDGEAFAVLIDGNHRLHKLACLEHEFAEVYLLDAQQTEQVIALGPDGPRSELGRLIQIALSHSEENP